jgi:hypothetical protein
MDAKAVAQRAAALLDDRLVPHGFARAAAFNSGKSHHLRWERCNGWRADRLELVRPYFGSLYAQVHVDILLEDGTPVSLHGTSVAFHLHGGGSWPGALQKAAFLGREERYAAWIADECARALSFFEQAATPRQAAAWAQSRERNGVFPPAQQHGEMLKRLESL